ncbi:MAG: hypothetical protein A2X84_08800 [Desulfuromonadaceae bacterium GWC2_58_13]|nr:MAG: hypothetical protein A2X84_08800 [Desulfuromonadaceae bacterium GWC2_58_13]
MRPILLVLFAVFLCFPCPVIAFEGKGYTETVDWWQGIIQDLQPSRAKLQTLYAATEDRCRIDQCDVKTEFLIQLALNYPGSGYDENTGGIWQVNGYTALNYDHNWEIQGLTQTFGPLTKTYDFQQNLFTVSAGENSLSIILDPEFPQRSIFAAAVIPEIAVSADGIYRKKSTPPISTNPIDDILNDVYCARVADGDDTRMDELAQEMVEDAGTQHQVLFQASEIYTRVPQPVETPKIVIEPPSSPPSVVSPPVAAPPNPPPPPEINRFDPIPWYFGAGFFGLCVLGALFFRTRRRILLQRAFDHDEITRLSVEEGSKTGIPAEDKMSIPVKADVPTDWSLDVLQSLEWKRFETVCVEYLRMTGYRPKETKIGADGCVDIRVYMPDIERPVGIVRCKALKSYQVGVQSVRELLETMAVEKIRNGRFITSGYYTAEAVECTKGQNLKLFSGRMFLDSIRELPGEKQKKLLKLALSGDYKTPTCPQCGGKMVLREGEGGAHIFWGCFKYPRCKATLEYQSIGSIDGASEQRSH